MLDRRTLIVTLAATSALAGVRNPAGALTAQAASGEGARLTAIYDRFYDRMIDESPEFATALGLDKDARLPLKAKLDAVKKIANLEANDVFGQLRSEGVRRGR